MHPSDAEAIEWDDHNELHLAGRGIYAEEVHQVLGNAPTWITNRRGRAGDWKAIGETDGGRHLTVVVAVDELRHAIRPFTGWMSTPRERRQR